MSPIFFSMGNQKVHRSIETFKLHELKLKSKPFNFDVEKYLFSCFIPSLLKRNDIPFLYRFFDITLQVYYKIPFAFIFIPIFK